MTPKPPAVDSWLTLSMLRLLAGVEKHRSVSAAARELGMAQSNASRSIRKLERRLGIALIERSPRGSVLTNEGLLTAGWGREVLDAVDRLTAGAETLGNSSRSELAVGASMTIAEHLLPGWIREFRGRHPHVATRLRVLNSSEVIEAVESGSVSLGFVETPVVPASLHSSPVCTDELVVAVGRTHPWAGSGKILDPDELAMTPLIEREEGSGTRAFLDVLVGGDRPPPILEFNSLSAIAQAAIEGIGPAILSRLAVERHLRTGQLIEVSVRGQGLNRVMRVLWRREHRLADPARQFLAVVGVADSRV